MKLKKRRKNYIILICLVLFNTFVIIDYIGRREAEKIKEIVIINVNKSISDYVFNSFNKEVLSNENIFNIIDLNMNANGELIAVDYHFDLAYKYLSESIISLRKNIINLEINNNYFDCENGVFFVSSLLGSNNILLENMGYKIPIKIKYLNNVSMGYKTKVSNYGLNNLLVELYLIVDVKNNFTSPSIFTEFGDKYEIVIASKVIVGDIPIYYGSTIENSSAIVSS